MSARFGNGNTGGGSGSSFTGEEKKIALLSSHAGVIEGGKVFIHPSQVFADAIFTNADSSINTAAGDFTVLLDNATTSRVQLSLDISSITRSVSTATVTTDIAVNRLETGQLVTIIGADQPEYNVVDAVITVTGLNTFTYAVAGTPVTPATGTIFLESDHTYNTGAYLPNEETMEVSGTASNDGTYTIVSVTANKIVVVESITDEGPISTTIEALWRKGEEDGQVDFVDKSDRNNPIVSSVSWANPGTLFSYRSQAVGIAVGPDYFVDSSLNPVEVWVPRKNPKNDRLFVYIGRIGVTNITTTPISIPKIAGMPVSDRDLYSALGSIRSFGVGIDVSPTDNQRLSIASGAIFRWGANVQLNPLNNFDNPNFVEVPASSEKAPFGYSTDGRAWYNPANNPEAIPAIAAQDIDRLNYWNDSLKQLDPVPNPSPWHVQKVEYFAGSNVYVVRYAQATFGTVDEAKAAIATSFPVEDVNLEGAGNTVTIGYIVMDKGNPDLTTAEFLPPLS